ncbi:hypothetical protein ACIGO9_00005 [Nocardia asteroides]|uniref:hypothetical protein n=1 Tax=Nocardia asteroides TaxID=1824 RepID=UPI0037CA7AEB
MVGGGSVVSSGDLVVGIVVRAAGSGEVGDGFAVICGGCRFGCERGGWVGVAETACRVDWWGEVVGLVGGGMGKG